MITNQKEEAMGYQGIGLPQTLLMAGVLLCAFVIAGCGSNESPPSSRKDAKPAASEKPLVKEILPGSNSGAAFPQKPLLGRPAEQPESNVTEVIPPDRPGGRGLTAQEINTNPIDPELIEVLPPDKPGGRGMTAAEFKAKASAVKPMDPQSVQVIPPANPSALDVTGAKKK